MLKTNVDAILEMLELNKPIALEEISKRLNISEEVVEKIAKYLDEEEILKLQYKFAKPYLALIKPFKKLEFAAAESYPDRQDVLYQKPVDKELEKDDFDKLTEMLNLVDSYLEKNDFASAGNLYKQLGPFFNRLPNSQIKRDLYKRIIKIYHALINNPYWEEKRK